MKNPARVITGVLSLSILVAFGWGITHTREILDILALRGYEPPARIVMLADQTTMKPDTRRIFYVNHPDLETKETFKNSCTNNQEQTIVLGCFVENRGIYLLDVSDPRLEGVIEVTAAHETLHAMYDRLSDSERAKVDKMTADFYTTLKDERIRQNIDNYRKSNPSVVPNELHSILASEVMDLSPELETYYSRYFKDRKAIVVYSEKYESQFVQLHDQAESYKKQLAQLKKTIDADEQQINVLGARIDTERKRLDKLLADNKIDEYNAGVAGYNSLVSQYRSLVDARTAVIDQYNQIVAKFNDLASTEADLYDALKTTPASNQTLEKQ